MKMVLEESKTAVAADGRHNYPPDKKRQVQALLQQLCPRNEKGEWQHSRLVRKLGLTPSYVSSILNAPDVCDDRHVNKIGKGAWVNMLRQLQEYANRDHAATTGFALVQRYCATMQQYSQVRRLRGFCGAGKSEGLKHYARYTDEAYHLECRTSQKPAGFLRALLTELGESKIPTRVEEMLDRATSRLLELERPVVLIDDIYYLTDRAMLLIKDLIDATAGHCGWLLTGEDSMEKRLTNGVDYKKPGYEALKDRTGRLPLEMPPLSKDDKLEYMRYRELERPELEEWLARNAKTYRELKSWIDVILRNPDDFRTATDLDEIFLNRFGRS